VSRDHLSHPTDSVTEIRDNTIIFGMKRVTTVFLALDHNNINSSTRNLIRLVVLRCIGLLIFILMIVIAIFGIDISLPIIPIAIILILIFFWNMYTWWRSHHVTVISDWEFFSQLTIDVFAISAVLYFTGGATNPFAWFFLLPLMIAAILLSPRFVWSITALTIISYSLLLQYHIPLVTLEMSHGSFMQHIVGMWFGFILSAVLVAYFVTSMANTLRQQEQSLFHVREQTLRDEQVVALGALAAGAAHELGTPLATIAILADELQSDYFEKYNSDLQTKLGIISSQVVRCKDAISVLSASSGEIRAESGKITLVADYLQQFILTWKQHRPNSNCIFTFQGENSQHIIAEKMLDQSLCNILDNATDVSPEHVEMNVQWDNDSLIIIINDHGPGLCFKANEALGKSRFSNKQHGLGVGLLLAHSVIERLQGEISFNNNSFGGLSIQIVLPILMTTINSGK